MNMAILSLLPLIVILGMIIIVVNIIMNRTVNKRGKYFFSRGVRIIFSGYLALLIICMGMDFLQPEKGMTSWKEVRAEDVEKERNQFLAAATAGNIDQLESNYFIERWVLKADAQEMNLVLDGEPVNIQIFVERKPVNDDEIDAAYYKMRTVFNGRDISGLSKPPELESRGDRLTVISPETTELKIAQMASPFPVNQFTGKVLFADDGPDFYQGNSILYLRIPKDLQLINNTDFYIEYVK